AENSFRVPRAYGLQEGEIAQIRRSIAVEVGLRGSGVVQVVDTEVTKVVEIRDSVVIQIGRSNESPQSRHAQAFKMKIMPTGVGTHELSLRQPGSEGADQSDDEAKGAHAHSERGDLGELHRPVGSGAGSWGCPDEPDRLLPRIGVGGSRVGGAAP